MEKPNAVIKSPKMTFNMSLMKDQQREKTPPKNTTMPTEPNNVEENYKENTSYKEKPIVMHPKHLYQPKNYFTITATNNSFRQVVSEVSSQGEMSSHQFSPKMLSTIGTRKGGDRKETSAHSTNQPIPPISIINEEQLTISGTKLENDSKTAHPESNSNRAIVNKNEKSPGE